MCGCVLMCSNCVSVNCLAFSGQENLPGGSSVATLLICLACAFEECACGDVVGVQLINVVH